MTGNMTRFFLKRQLLVILIFSLILFLPSINNFFFDDDWYILQVSQISNFQHFLNFFSFVPNDQTIPFYRPISTQGFYFVFHSLFGLNPLPYRIFIFGLFLISTYLVYKFSLIILKDRHKSLVAAFLFGISVTNFTKIYYIIASQEYFMVIFVLLSLYQYLKSDSWKSVFRSVLFFILALMSKENAVVLPVIILGLSILEKRFSITKVGIYFIVLLGYLYCWYFLLNVSKGQSYTIDLSLFKSLNTFFWYSLWSFGAPEFLVDYVGSGLKIIPRFFSDFLIYGFVLIALIITTLVTFGINLVYSLKRIKSKIFLTGAGIFLTGLIPVIFLPTHKYNYLLTLSMVGFCIMLGFLIDIKKKWGKAFFICFVFLNLYSNYLTQINHYSVARAKISHNVYDYFKENYPEPPKDKYFLFVNDAENRIPEWGVSKQIAQLISYSNMFKILYNDPHYKVYYEDYPDKLPESENIIKVSTAQFLK